MEFPVPTRGSEGLCMNFSPCQEKNKCLCDFWWHFRLINHPFYLTFFFLVSHQVENLQEQIRVKRKDRGDD